LARLPNSEHLGGARCNQALDNLTACRREMAKIYRLVTAQKLPVEVGTRLIYMIERLRVGIEAEQSAMTIDMPPVQQQVEIRVFPVKSGTYFDPPSQLPAPDAKPEVAVDTPEVSAPVNVVVGAFARTRAGGGGEPPGGGAAA
jgi:hypothetical protein